MGETVFSMYVCIRVCVIIVALGPFVRPDPDSCSQSANTSGESKTDIRGDSEIQTGSYSADPTVI